MELDHTKQKTTSSESDLSDYEERDLALMPFAPALKRTKSTLGLSGDLRRRPSPIQLPSELALERTKSIHDLSALSSPKTPQIIRFLEAASYLQKITAANELLSLLQKISRESDSTKKRDLLRKKMAILRIAIHGDWFSAEQKATLLQLLSELPQVNPSESPTPTVDILRAVSFDGT
jgi:hypothetical protein